MSAESEATTASRGAGEELAPRDERLPVDVAHGPDAAGHANGPTSAPRADPAVLATSLANVRAILSEVLAGRATLRRAAVALGMAVEELPPDRAGRRLAVWRAYVGAAVGTASPLAVRACGLHGVALDGLVSRLGPNRIWDQWLCGVRPHDAWLRSGSGGLGVLDAPMSVRRDWALREWLHGDWPFYGSDLRLRLGVRVLDGGLEMAAFPGGHRLRTHGTEGSITLAMELPQTVMAALPGRDLDRLVSHPLIDGAGAVVVAVDEPHPRWGTKVRFSLDPVPWRMPWARPG